MEHLQQQRTALGSEATLSLVAANDAAVANTFAELWRLIDDFEARFSRFRQNSELSIVNARAGEWTIVSPEFIELASEAKALSLATHGIFNPLVLPALQKAGYKGSWPHPEQYEDKLNYESRAGISDPADLQLLNQMICLPHIAAIDFGGLGKGFLLDKLAQYLLRQGQNRFWLSLGGDIICSGTDKQGALWEIGIASAQQGSGTVGSLDNAGGAVLAIATSGITRRRGNDAGPTAKPWHHLIDPRTGLPADTDVQTATVTAKTATIADIMAKCVVILGSSAGQAFCEEQPDILSACIQAQNTEPINYTKQRN